MKKKFKFKKSVKIIFTLIVVGAFCYFSYNYFMKDGGSVESVDDKKVVEKTETSDKLTSLGFSKSDVEILEENLDEKDINLIDTYNENIINFVSNSYFEINNLERYINYMENNDYTTDEVVTYVNIGIDKPFYTDIKTINNPNGLLVLCNKYNALPSDYEPEDLTEVGSSGIYMRKEAAENMYAMVLAAEAAGLHVNLVSGYRSYDYQVELYARHVRERGETEADRVSARPGHSEHQTGLAMDLSNDWTLEKYFEDTELFEWLSQNDYKYGFILRYPKDKEYITGYDYEPWHYRYVGVEVATVIHNEDITYEEYVMKYLSD